MSFGQKPPRQNYNQNKPKLVREVLKGEHECDPNIEAIMGQGDKLQPFNSAGNVLPTEMVRFDTPSGGMAIEAYKAMMIVSNGFCVNLDNPHYPEIKKLKTLENRSVVYADYKAKIKWKHSEDFWHIPCFTRYVINEKGNIKNAYNGMDIKPNDWGQYMLVADQYQAFNKPLPTDMALLMTLSQKPIPQGFKDYGYRTYSHRLAFNPADQKVDLVPRPEIYVRDGNGQIEEGLNVTEFAAIYLKNKDVGEFRKVSDEALRLGSVQVGQYTIKAKDGQYASPAPEVNVSSVPAQNAELTAQTTSTTPPPMDAKFDDDIPF